HPSSSLVSLAATHRASALAPRTHWALRRLLYRKPLADVMTEMPVFAGVPNTRNGDTENS
ncbi:MAG: hypothetical protein ACREHV_13805, partial [Rhizomicrobium sp.]